jgi:hypothetical protein
MKKSIPIPVPKQEVKVFDKLPAANRDTFEHSLPTAVDEDGKVEHIVLFSPNYENIAILDNTDGSGTTTYSKAFTRGFSSTLGTTLGIKSTTTVDAVVAKESIELSFQVSFSTTWNESETQTTTFSVPAGKQAYLYQGTLLSQIIRWDQGGTELNNYEYIGSPSLTQSPSILTRNTPLIDKV